MRKMKISRRSGLEFVYFVCLFSSFSYSRPNPRLFLSFSYFRPDLLAVYRLTLRTNWDEVSFPRQVNFSAIFTNFPKKKSATICEKIFKRSYIQTHGKGQRHLFSGGVGKFLVFLVPFTVYSHISLANPWTKYAKLKHTLLKDSEKLFICHVSVLLIP